MDHPLRDHAAPAAPPALQLGLQAELRRDSEFAKCLADLPRATPRKLSVSFEVNADGDRAIAKRKVSDRLEDDDLRKCLTKIPPELEIDLAGSEAWFHGDAEIDVISSSVADLTVRWTNCPSSLIEVALFSATFELVDLRTVECAATSYRWESLAEGPWRVALHSVGADEVLGAIVDVYLYPDTSHDAIGVLAPLGEVRLIPKVPGECESLQKFEWQLTDPIGVVTSSTRLPCPGEFALKLTRAGLWRASVEVIATDEAVVTATTARRDLRGVLPLEEWVIAF